MIEERTSPDRLPFDSDPLIQPLRSTFKHRTTPTVNNRYKHTGRKTQRLDPHTFVPVGPSTGQTFVAELIDRVEHTQRSPTTHVHHNQEESRFRRLQVQQEEFRGFQFHREFYGFGEGFRFRFETFVRGLCWF